MAWMPSLPSLGTDVAPTDDATAQLMLKRKLAIADALRNQEMPQGQMVSGHYVAPSWTQYLGNLANKWVGGQQENEAIKGYQDYLGQQKKTCQDALATAIKRLGPQDITEQSTYDIQVPSGKTPTPNDNLGGMQPYESGMKTIQVPMTTKTGTRQPSYEDALAALGDYATAINQPDLAEKLMMNRATTLMTPDSYDIHNVGDVGYVVNKRTGLPTGKTIGEPKSPDYGTASNSTARALFGKDFKDLNALEQKRVVDYNNQFKLGNLVVAKGNLGVNQQNANFATGGAGAIRNPTSGKTTTLSEIQDYAKKNNITFEQAKQHAIDLGYSF